MTEHTDKKSRVRAILLVLMCIFALLGISLWVVLKQGIEIDRIDLSSLTAENIRIQLDDGLTITADQLSIQKKPASQDTSKLPEFIIARINNWRYLVREIRINRVNFREQTYQLLFRNNQFTISGDEFQLTTTLAFTGKKLQLDISSLEFKPYALNLSGKGVYDSATQKISMSGSFNVLETNGQFTLSQHKDLINVEINTLSFTDLAGLLERFPLDRELTTWIRENLSAANYRIDQLKLDMVIRNGKPDIQTDSISCKGVATDTAIRFHPSLPHVQSKQIHVSFEHDRLFFELDDPMYESKSLAGSNVLITDLFADNTQMDINIQTETQLDSDIHALLETYDISIPFSQQKGVTRADLHLLFDLPDFSLQTNGLFTTDEGDWTCKNLPFHTIEATVKLKNDLAIIQRAKIEHQDILKADLVGSVDTTAQKASLTAGISHLQFKDGEKDIIKATGLRTPITVQFSGDEVKINLLILRTNIFLSSSRRQISFNRLNKVSSIIPSLRDLPIQNGRVEIDFTDLNNLTFDGLITTPFLPISSGGEPVTQFTFKGNKTPQLLDASINDGKISLQASDKLTIKLYDYLLTADIDSFGKKAGTASPVPISIIGPASLIKLKNTSIPTKNFAADLTLSNVFYTAELKQGTLLFESNNENMTITASDIDAQVARDFFRFADLEGGRFDLSLKGKSEKDYEGFVEFNNVTIKDVAILNNVLSFINAIPALATLSSPGFDSNGYRVEKGVAHFTVNNNLLTIQQLRTDGTTINTEAAGWIDFENDITKMKIELISLKDYSKIIDLIPLAGYAILGEDGSMSTSLDITGSLTEPEINTNLASDIGMIPINIVKRIIQWPFRLFDKLKESEPLEPKIAE